MEYVLGRPLSELIAAGPMPPEQVRVIMGQAALALASAHEAGVVHRDVKPANILVTADGQVKLTDFGIAHAADSAAHTRTGEVLGTPQYLSPEQALGRTVTGATDLYSLGIVGHEMLTGQRPFDAGSAVATALAQVNDAPPPLPAYVRDPLRAAVESCLAKDPAQRPSSAASLAAMLGMPVSGLGSALPATSVIATTDLAMTQPMSAAGAHGSHPARGSADRRGHPCWPGRAAREGAGQEGAGLVVAGHRRRGRCGGLAALPAAPQGQPHTRGHADRDGHPADHHDDDRDTHGRRPRRRRRPRSSRRPTTSARTSPRHATP